MGEGVSWVRGIPACKKYWPSPNLSQRERDKFALFPWERVCFFGGGLCGILVFVGFGIFGGCHAEMLFEDGGEICLVVETNGEGHLGDVDFPLADETRRLLQTMVTDELTG